MVGRRKSKKARSKELSRILKEEDRISQLPDPLICHILSCLPIKEAIRTSVMSTRWRSLWLWVPCLNLNSEKSLDSNVAKVDISLPFGLEVFDEASVLSRRISICGLILGISKVMDMTICKDTFKLICQSSRLKPLPKFAYMSRLHINLRVSGLNRLPNFLKSFPNLKSLILAWHGHFKKWNQVSFSSVPECLLSSLEFVDFEVAILEFTGEMKLIRYFLEKSAILKILTLRLNNNSSRKAQVDFLTKLVRIQKRSTECEVVVL